MEPDLWRQRASEKELYRRFAALSPIAQQMLVLGCLKHAAEPMINGQQNSRTRAALDLLRDLWPRGEPIEHDRLMRDSREAYDLCADAEGAQDAVSGEGPLLDGLFYALDGLEGNSREEALAALDQGYWIAVSLAFPNFSGYGDILDRLARASKPCVDEMAFQLDLLDYLERYQHPENGYDELLAGMNKWIRSGRPTKG